MRATFHIFYNGESCKDVGLSVISRPTIPVPEREYDTIKVEGRDGELHRDKKTYKDIEIPISFNFVSKTAAAAASQEAVKVATAAAEQAQNYKGLIEDIYNNIDKLNDFAEEAWLDKSYLGSGYLSETTE